MTITEQDIRRAQDWEDKYTDAKAAVETISIYELMAEYAAHVTSDLRQQLAEKDGEIVELRKIAKDCSLEADKYARAVDKAHKRIAAAEERAAETLTLLNAEISKRQWQPINTARKDGAVIWGRLRSDIYPNMCPDRNDLERWNGVQVPLRHHGLEEDGFDIGWSVAAPVGCGGFPDCWIEGWMPMPEPPKEASDD